MASFQDLKLATWMKQQLKNIGLAKPTPIQTNCIPAILDGQDVIGVAQTGSGKTMAFALPILHTLSQDPYGIYALVLTPTRELAFQIADQFRVVGKSINLRDCVVVGGRNMVTQGQDLAKKPHVVIATPGRLADHLETCDTFNFKHIKYLVIDEADRMFDGSFDDQLATIFRALPPKRQTLLFTATITDSLEKLKEVSMEKPFYYEAPSKTKTADLLEQRYVLTPLEARDGYLVHIIQTLKEQSSKGQMIVFVKMCKTCEVLSLMLRKFEFSNVSLHSQKPQRDRLAALARFRSKQAQILIATDVASRGLDIPAVEFVINHDVPQVSKNYVHRVGRTARAGRRGLAVTLVTPHDVILIKAIEELIETELDEMTVDDNKVAEILTQVNVTKREQEIVLDKNDFDEKRQVNKRKRLILEGLDPDEEERRRNKERRKMIKKEVKERKRRQKEERMKQAESEITD